MPASGADPSFLSLQALSALLRTDTLMFGKDIFMPIGTVKFFSTEKGYGFIAPEDGGDDNFVHISAIERAGMATLNKGDRVSYELETDRRGKQSAVNLQAA